MGDKKDYDKDINRFISEFKKMLNQDIYIARSDYVHFIDEYKDPYSFFVTLIETDKNTFNYYCNSNRIDIVNANYFIEKYAEMIDLKNGSKTIINHNVNYINKKLIREKDCLDNLLKDSDPNIRLDLEQRKVVLSEEDYTLVIAGAGAGKTTTVEAKVKYLVDIKKSVDAKDILVVTFTNKAVEELKKRIHGKLKIKDCEISTFHKIGYNIVNKNKDKSPTTEGFLFTVLNNYLKKDILGEAYMVDRLIDFFAKYIEAPFCETTLKGIFELKSKGDYETMKSYIKDYSEKDFSKINKMRMALADGEFVKSYEEADIANFLYRNSIDYVYEKQSPYRITDSNKLYEPDFYVTQGDKSCWIEHYGMLNEDGSSQYDGEKVEVYKKAIQDKRELYNKYKEKENYIETYNSYNDKRSYLEHLQEELEKIGFVFKKRSSEEIYKKVVELEESKYIRKLVSLLTRFISNFKSAGYGVEKFDELRRINRNASNSPRTDIFLELCYKCYLEYERRLKEKNLVDFNDMINDSVKILEDITVDKSKIVNHYKYIIVDEYQDISQSRFKFTKTLADVLGAKIMAVGDDWQSIYAFSGSDVKLFTDFQEKMGYALRIDIENTYRNSQELIDIAGEFILRNPKQLKKKLKSNKHIDKPIVIRTYIEPNDEEQRQMKHEGKKGGVYYYLGLLVDDMIKTIINYNPLLYKDNKPIFKKKSKDEIDILLIGRYGFDAENLGKNSNLFYYDKAKKVIKSKSFPNIDIAFLTAHSSKGLSANNVIIINALNAVYGFPSKIEDDPILQNVICNDKGIDYAEERRLFYVALTRTKNKVYIAVPEKRPSEFIVELLTDEKYKNIERIGTINLKDIAKKDRIKLCPICGAPLVYHYNKNYGLKLYMCTNEPEVCGFITNDIGSDVPMSIHFCDNCKDGFLIVKKGINKLGDKGSPYYLECTKNCKDKEGKIYRISARRYKYWLNDEGCTKNSIKNVFNRKLAASICVGRIAEHLENDKK